MMIESISRRHARTGSLWKQAGSKQEILQHLAAHPWLGQLFQRVVEQADRDLQSLPSELATPANLQDTSLETQDERELRWYGESQEAHRAGEVIVRLALCAWLNERPDFAAAAVARMQTAAAQPTFADSPMQDLVVGGLARGLCLGYDLVRDMVPGTDPDSESETWAAVRARLLQYGDWLEYYLVKGGNGARRNHDVIAACTLGLIALTLPNAAPRDWAPLAAAQLETVLFADTRYLGEDGDWYEGSLRYQLYILQWFHLLADAARTVGWMDLYARSKAEKLFRSLSHFLTPDGHNLGFNDTAHDEVVLLGVWPLLKGAVEYQDPLLLWNLQNILDRLDAVPLIPAEAFLALRGPLPGEPFHKKRQTAVHLKRTGLVVVRSEWSGSASLFALGCGPYSSHHHLGQAGFEYYASGEPVVLEAGGGHYVGRAQWITPEMHNVVVVNGGYRPRYAHPLYGTSGFDFAPRFDGRITAFKHNPEVAFVQADYALCARTRSAVRNSWFVWPGYLIVEDRLTAPDGSPLQAEAFWHAHGDVQAAPDGTYQIRTAGGETHVLAVCEPEVREISLGRHPLARDSIGVVMSGGELRVPARRREKLDYIRVTARGPDVRFLVFVVPSEIEGLPVEFSHQMLPAAQAWKLEIRFPHGVVDTWVFLPRRAGLVQEPLEMDGRVAFVRCVAGRAKAWFLLEGQTLACAGETLVRSPVETTFLNHRGDQ
ncbi:MAG: heparinase II/III-family protein [Ardenticatenaceae bacterium]|nr:heparinase II/III-family protein [Ardenticatenaceae bacterium]